MRVSLNSVLSSEFFNFSTNKISILLSPLQKKVVFVVMPILACLSVCCLFVYYNRQREINKQRAIKALYTEFFVEYPKKLQMLDIAMGAFFKVYLKEGDAQKLELSEKFSAFGTSLIEFGKKMEKGRGSLQEVKKISREAEVLTTELTEITEKLKKAGYTEKVAAVEIDLINKKVTLTRLDSSGSYFEGDYFSVYKEALSHFPKDCYLAYYFGFGSYEYLYYDNTDGEIRNVRSYGRIDLQTTPEIEAKIQDLEHHYTKIEVDETLGLKSIM